MRYCLLLACLLVSSTVFAASKPVVREEAPNLHGSRALEPETQKAVIRDYLQSWTALEKANHRDNPQLLDQDFVGNALKKLSKTITDQEKLGIRTRYKVASHDIQIVFYSPNGLSIELTDQVAYREQVEDGSKALADKTLHATYLVVLTPSAVRWVVRVFQAMPEKPAAK